MIIYTVTCADNLHEARVMAKSVKRHMPNVKVILCLAEKTIHPAAVRGALFDEVILAKDSFLFKYSLFEGVTALKPYVTLKLLRDYPAEKHFLYMDADIKMYYPFHELESKLKKANILLSPHAIEPISAKSDLLYYGTYNSGLIGISRSAESQQFLEWWASRLYNQCIKQGGIYYDQKWLDLAPALFDVHIFKNPAYNVGAWNLAESGRMITKAGNGEYRVHGQPLCCFHFSGLDSFLPTLLQQLPSERQSTLRSMLDGYRSELLEQGRRELEHVPWSYDFFDSGERISNEMRDRFRKNPGLAAAFPTPYQASGQSLKQ
jgi:hypothetical protein